MLQLWPIIRLLCLLSRSDTLISVSLYYFLNNITNTPPLFLWFSIWIPIVSIYKLGRNSLFVLIESTFFQRHCFHTCNLIFRQTTCTILERYLQHPLEGPLSGGEYFFSCGHNLTLGQSCPRLWLCVGSPVLCSMSSLSYTLYVIAHSNPCNWLSLAFCNTITFMKITWLNLISSGYNLVQE